MTNQVLARRWPEKLQRHRRRKGAVHLIRRDHTPYPSPRDTFLYCFHRCAQLVQAFAEDYSVSPKLSAVSRRNAWPL